MFITLHLATIGGKMSATSIIQHPGPGCVVEFMQGNAPMLAWVLEEQSGKLRLYTLNKRETKLPASRLLPWSGPALSPDVSKNDIEAELNSRQEKRQTIEASLDVAELWEMAQGEVPSAPAPWFAEMIFQEPDADQIAAMGRALLAGKSHYKFQPPEFTILDPEAVERKQTEMERERIRQKLVSSGRDFLRAVWDGKSPAEPEKETADKLRELLMALMADPEDADYGPIWRDLRKGFPDSPHLPLLLAQKWGIVPNHYNFHLDQADYERGNDWSTAYADEIAAQMQRVEALDTPEAEGFLSIDSASTRDIDDAFHLEDHPDGGFRLRLALANPAFAWNFGGPLDKAVFDRSTSIYLPEGSLHMMPEEMGTGVYSLLEGKVRPSMVMDFHLDATGHLLDCDIRMQTVRLAHNITYDLAEEAIEGESTPDWGPMVARAAELGELLRQVRIQHGAIVIDRPDPEVVLHEEGANTRVEVVMKPATPKAQVLVSEMMILANEAVANWAAEREIGLYHRTQDFTLPKEYAGLWTEPHDIFAIVKQFGPSLLEVEPRPHRGLGLQAYAPSTSPLRRYPDLVNCAQIGHWLAHGTPRWSKEELETMRPRLVARLEAAGQVQRFRPRYWKLEFCRQNRKSLREAVAVDDNGNFITLAVPELQIFVRADKKLAGEKCHPGMLFMISFGKVDPLMNEIHVAEVLEA
ncbi:MAG: ribonuclease catalytic domain-containing protein [Desulfovibrio sp.]|uniref:ribonuclease catalytic domain-containing protein n=1 Tax=Desulfovibrio sp. 7SRBS1 TaxID=3378064 RepID=UPI003B3D9760